MRLHRLEIHNYKSLRNVAIEPTPLSVFVGPNASGKTNLSDAIDFLRHIYAWGLEKAVAYKGGYESICYRDSRRSKEPIAFRVVLEFPEFSVVFPYSDKEPEPTVFGLIDHSFSFKARTAGIPSNFAIVSEQIIYSSRNGSDIFQEKRRIIRDGERVEGLSDAELEDFWLEQQGGELESSLILPMVESLRRPTKSFESLMGSLRVFQLDPRSCRESGVPTPNPDLDRAGRNLPVALDHLKKVFPEEYDAVLTAARRVMPSLEAIETDWTHTRSLALFLKERGIRRHWTSEDVSSGTLQMIALLVAAFDPRIPLVVIEEPENSIHPWALRSLVEAFRLATEKKQILLTTHSPILLDQVRPEEVWIVQKPGTETRVDPLLSFDPHLSDSWNQGKYSLSEYLDSGAIPEAVPADS
jgi:predicted ATPase